MADDNVLHAALALAAQKASDHGVDGRDDRHAFLRAQIEAYQAGMQRAVPSWLSVFMKEAQQRQDPEYTEYQRLRRKFER